MSTEPNEENKAVSAAESRLAVDDVLKATVDKDEVIGFIEGMVHAMGSAAAGQMLPTNPLRKQQEPPSKKYQSKAVAAIMQKLERLHKYPDLANVVMDDEAIHEWLERTGCKQKEYYDELECAQELTSFFGGYRRFDLAIQSASKARNITVLHRRDDEETLAELNWVLADLHAASDKMEQAMEWMQRCLDLLEPGAGPDHPTYKELLAQLQETNQKTRMVAV